MAVLNIYFTWCSLRINAVFALIFIGAGLGFALLAAALWGAAEASSSSGNLFVVCLKFFSFKFSSHRQLGSFPSPSPKNHFVCIYQEVPQH